MVCIIRIKQMVSSGPEVALPIDLQTIDRVDVEWRRFVRQETGNFPTWSMPYR